MSYLNQLLKLYAFGATTAVSKIMPSGLIPIPAPEGSDFYYKSKKVGKLIVDLIVESKLIIEIKALTGKIPAVFKFQLLSYLKVSDLKVGLLINFGNKSCQVNRFVN